MGEAARPPAIREHAQLSRCLHHDGSLGLQCLVDRAKEPAMKVLIVLTSHDKLGDTGRKTGFWLEELAAPYYVFKDAGAQITLASPKGGRPPLDPKSQDPNFQT